MVDVSMKDDESGTLYEEHYKRPIKEDVEDCCQVAKDIFHESVNNLLQRATGREKEVLPELLTVEHLQCTDFNAMLVNLNNITSAAGDTITATINAIGRYIRVDKVPTSMFSTVANIVKTSAAEAHTAWKKCQSNTALNVADSTWQSQLLQSEDLRFHTWDNILLAAYKPLNDEQKSLGMRKDALLNYAMVVLEDGEAKTARGILDGIIDLGKTNVPHVSKLTGLLLGAANGNLNKPPLRKFNNQIEKVYPNFTNKIHFRIKGSEEE